MQKDLDKLKSIFLSDEIDGDDYQENLQTVTQWEQSIIKNENLLSWQEHDITKEILKKAKESYVDLSLRLGTDKKLEQHQRDTMFAKQESMLWLLSIADENPRQLLEQIDDDIKKALSLM